MALNFANNNSLSAITSLPASITGGALTLLETQTASSSATISFTSNIDSTYDAYMFKFYDIHPASDTQRLTFQASTDGGSNYNTTVTSTAFGTYNYENDSDRGLANDSNNDGRNQETNFQPIVNTIGNDNDQSGVATLTIYQPSSSTFVKHWISSGCIAHNEDLVSTRLNAGYFNTTSPINAFQFKMGSGNLDSGVIKLYGIS